MQTATTKLKIRLLDTRHKKTGIREDLSVGLQDLIDLISNHKIQLVIMYLTYRIKFVQVRFLNPLTHPQIKLTTEQLVE